MSLPCPHGWPPITLKSWAICPPERLCLLRARRDRDFDRPLPSTSIIAALVRPLEARAEVAELELDEEERCCKLLQVCSLSSPWHKSFVNPSVWQSRTGFGK